MTNLQSLREPFDVNGYVVVPNFLSGHDFTELTDNIDRYIRDIVPTLSDNTAFYQDLHRPETLKQLQGMERDPYFLECQEHPRWKNMAESLLGESAFTKDSQWFNKPPKTEHATPPHQDNFYFGPNNLESMVTAWIALDDADVSIHVRGQPADGRKADGVVSTENHGHDSS